MRRQGETTAADDSNPLTTEEIDNKLEVASRFITVDGVEKNVEAKVPTAKHHSKTKFRRVD